MVGMLTPILECLGLGLSSNTGWVSVVHVRNGLLLAPSFSLGYYRHWERTRGCGPAL